MSPDGEDDAKFVGDATIGSNEWPFQKDIIYNPFKLKISQFEKVSVKVVPGCRISSQS